MGRKGGSPGASQRKLSYSLDNLPDHLVGLTEVEKRDKNGSMIRGSMMGGAMPCPGLLNYAYLLSSI